jgi:uncharacterized protein YecE (DUF72 family)
MTQPSPARAQAPRLWVGTSGFSYAEWKGSFYPEDLPAKRMLGSYAERLPAVEINNTFYRLPRASVLAGWAAQVPPGFRFAIKASRRITHLRRLKDAQDETAYLMRTLESLGERLGCVLFQLPPYLRADAERLDRFLEQLPAGVPVAFEFRHPSWNEPPILERLRARQAALVWMDDEAGEPESLERTAPHAYLRLRRERYERGELARWLVRLQDAGFEQAFVFFKHEDAGAGPVLAATLLDLAERASARRPALRAGAPPPDSTRKIAG